MSIEEARKVAKARIRQRIDLISGVLAEHGVRTLPYIMEDLPVYATDFHNYIREKARADLPECQFTGKINPRNLADLVEVGGNVGYNGNLFEIRYVKPDGDSVVIEETPEGKFVRSSLLGEPYIDFQGWEKSDVVLDWHTHPIPSTPSDKDFNYMLRFDQMLKQYFDVKPVLFALYLPTLDQIHWFGMQTKSE